MKNFLFFAIVFLGISLMTSCTKDDSTVSDDVLMQEIAISSSKVNVEPAELPSAALNTIETEQFDTYIETVGKVDGKGFEINLGNEDVLYCNMQGRMLEPRGFVRGRPHRPGPCGIGRPIPVDSLPAVIVDYVAANYDNATIVRAKVRGDRYIVLITTPTSDRKAIIVFALNGDVIEATHVFHHCRDWGTPVDATDLPAKIVDYINANYTDAEIVKAVRTRGGKIIVGILINGDRKVVVFDADGNFLFDRG